VITFQKSLIEYSTHNIVNPPVPIGGPNGYWTIPTGKLVFYVQIQTDVGVPSDVYLTAQSVFEIAPFNSPGAVQYFFIIAPISKTYCLQAFTTIVDCNLVDSSTAHNPVYPTTGNAGDPLSISKYIACPKPPQNYNDAAGNCLAYGKRYVIPKPTTSGQRGPPVIVAFAATAASGDNAQNNNAGDGTSVTSFLGLSYVYDSGVSGSEYVYGVTLPFISMCVSNNAPTPNCSG
jgi:hypothetical protein